MENTQIAKEENTEKKPFEPQNN